MSPRFTLLAALMSLAACAAAAQPETAIVEQALARGLSCEVRAMSTPRGLALEAVAYAETAMLGEYEFVVTKDDGGGASDIAQGGAFEAEAGRTTSLGEVELSLARGGRLNADLVVRDAEGGEVCRDAYRS